MRYFMFIDESGEANIANSDPNFNVFVLCGIVFREDCHYVFNEEVKKLKIKYFKNADVVFHSVDMRQKKGVYKIFLDSVIMSNFYTDIEIIFRQCKYHIISCVIDKEKYKEKYPDKNHAYEDSLKFLCERAIILIGRKSKTDILHICLEKRQPKKDSFLKSHYTNFVKYGTQYVSTDEFKMCNSLLHFRGKQENINGLQWADLCAYPIGRKCLNPDKSQPTFDLFEDKFFCNQRGEYDGIGLKRFP